MIRLVLITLIGLRLSLQSCCEHQVLEAGNMLSDGSWLHWMVARSYDCLRPLLGSSSRDYAAGPIRNMRAGFRLE